MAELVDALVSGASVARHGGSSPLLGTKTREDLMGQIFFYKGDLPDDIIFSDSIAVDTETMGLNLHRDRLCLVQIGDGKGNAYLTQIVRGHEPKNLKKVLTDKNILKIFHYARFDVAKLWHDLGIVCAPVYCTKIAHKLVRPCAASHSLKALCQEMLDVTLCKEQQQSDWGAEVISDEQKTYAANDVLYLHQLKAKLDALLLREDRMKLAQACFDFLPYRGQLDVDGFDCPDIFEH